jgi:hypothetical protein
VRLLIWASWILAAAAAQAAGNDKGGKEVGLSLSSRDARCLADNADILLREKGDPVDFYFDLCLDEASAAAVRGSSRQSLPTLTKSGAPKASGLDGKAEAGPVKVTKALLKCVQDKRARDSGYFDKEPVVCSSFICQK